MASGTYKLDLEPQKRNVFVTQLHQREDEEEDVHSYPVVREQAGRLVDTGINTLQKTLLLKKEVEVERVDEELTSKRKEFRERMNFCEEKQIEIQKRQQRMKERVSKFEKFIQENEAKRRRAIQKYQSEVALKEQKHRERELLEYQLAELRERQFQLKNRLKKYEIYKNYLNKVLDILPAHYLQSSQNAGSDNMLNALMMRHRTLSATNEQCVDNLAAMVDEMERQKAILEDLKAEHNKKKVSINSQLSKLQKEQEVMSDKNEMREQKFGAGKKELRQARADFGEMMMAIDSIAEKCLRRYDVPFEEMDIDYKLTMIQEHIIERSDVARKVAQNEESPPSRESAAQPKKKVTIMA